MRHGIALLSVALFPLAGLACVPGGSTPGCRTSGVTTHHDVRYRKTPGVDARYQSLDVYVPSRPAKCAPSALVVWVHGGAYIKGDKANKITDKVRLFTNAGWAFASVDYRLVGGAGAGNAMYPAPESDVAHAVAYLRSHANTYRVDPKHVMLLGHSAGAFLVSLVSTDASFLRGAGLDLHSVVCTASLDTTYDIPAQVAAGGTEARMYRNAFGNDPAVWRRASPVNNVGPAKGIPSFHVVTRGSAHRIAQSQTFGATLRNARVGADVQVVRGLTHNEVNDAVGQRGETTVTPPLMRFFMNCAATRR